MPTPNPTSRREFKGAAAATTLQNSMTNTDTSFVLVAASNWPTGAVGKFVVCINRGQADEEKILCDTQTSRTVACLLANRGFDGTTAQAHAAGATVECVISAFDADEWNQHTNATSGVHGVAGPVADTNSVQTFTNKTLNGATLDAASTVGGVTGTTLATAAGAWTSTSFTADATTAGYTASARASTLGKTMHVQGRLVFSGTSSGTVLVSGFSPGTIRTPASDVVCGICQLSTVSGAGIVWVDAPTGKLKFQIGAFGNYAGTGAATSNGVLLAFDVTVELA